jgi:hypothetical protein
VLGKQKDATAVRRRVKCDGAHLIINLNLPLLEVVKLASQS